MKYCPKCLTEYEEWVIVCAECDVELVHALPKGVELPEEAPDANIKFKELLRTFNSGDVVFIKSLLDSCKITYYFNGEMFLLMRPAVEAARLMVDETQYDEAREILKDFKSSFTSFSTSDE